MAEITILNLFGDVFLAGLALGAAVVSILVPIVVATVIIMKIIDAI